MHHVIFLFVDGIGIAPAYDTNPFAQAAMPVLRKLLGGSVTEETGRVIASTAAMVPISALLDMPGLPQSGTGQATLMTGKNCAMVHGAHFGPYPPAKVRTLLTERNLFSRFVARGLPVEFINAFPRQYFEHYDKHPVMIPAIASSYRSSGKSLHLFEEIPGGRAISADICGDRLSSIGYHDIPAITAHEAGVRSAHIASENAFTMFEYWLTDKAGHKQDMAAACSALEKLDGFIGGILDAMNHDTTTIVLTSDHGNMEDCSVPTHTFNPVPLIVLGYGAKRFVSNATSLIDVAPNILAIALQP